MTVWEKPNFEELAMNAEIGAYQAEPEGGERDVPFVREPVGESKVTPRTAASGG